MQQAHILFPKICYLNDICLLTYGLKIIKKMQFFLNKCTCLYILVQKHLVHTIHVSQRLSTAKFLVLHLKKKKTNFTG